MYSRKRINSKKTCVQTSNEYIARVTDYRNVLEALRFQIVYWKEVVKEVERLCGKLFCTHGIVTLGEKKEMIGKGMTSEGNIQSAMLQCCNEENER